MKLAIAFGRADVDGLLDELTADEFAEWQAFFAINPVGWDAANLTTARLAHAAVQPHVRRQLKESEFLIRLAADTSPVDRDAFERAKAESAAIRQTIRAKRHAI